MQSRFFNCGKKTSLEKGKFKSKTSCSRINKLIFCPSLLAVESFIIMLCCWHGFLLLSLGIRLHQSSLLAGLPGYILHPYWAILDKFYEEHKIGFQTFFVWAFKIVVDGWKFSMLLLYILWDDWPMFMISGSNEQLLQEIEYTLLKPDCHSWWISKIQTDILEERYVIKFCFKLGKNATKTHGMLQTTFRPSCINRASVFEWHKRLKEGRESVRDDNKCRRSNEVRTPELIGQSIWVRVTMLRF